MTPDQVVVVADGGSRGNPGPAGYGAAVLDATGTEVLAQRAGGLGTTTNNVAEYRGVIAGLQAAIDLGATGVEVRMDSKLVVEQLSGRWKVRHPDLRPLAAEATALMGRFGSVSLQWVPRAENAIADRLANEAMDAQADGRDWSPHDPAPASAPAVNPAEHDPAAGVPSLQALPPGARPGSTTLLVVRHGTTTWGQSGRFAGREDVPLADDGLAEAHAVAARLASASVTVVLSSPLQRCRRTAEIIAQASGIDPATIQIDENLGDGALGDWTGYTAGQIAEGWPTEFGVWRSDPDAAPPGGESFTDVRRRAEAAIGAALAAHRGGVVAIVTHAAVAKMLLIAALAVPTGTAYRTRVDNCSISMITVDADDAVTVCSMNDTGHLTTVP